MAKNKNDRPYINLLTKDFGPEVEKNSSNPDELRKLRIEIGHRKKAKNKLLPLIEAIDGHLASCLPSFADPELAPKKVTAKSKPRVRVRIGETGTEKTFVEDVAPDTKPVALGQIGTIRPPSNLLKRLPTAWLPEKKETKIKGLDEASTTPHEFGCALAYLIWEIRNSGSASKTLLLNGGRKEPSFSGEYGSLYAFRYDGNEDVFEGARIEVRIGNKKTGGSISSILMGHPRAIVLSLDDDFGSTIKSCSVVIDGAALLEPLKLRFDIELGLADQKAGKPVGMNHDLADGVLWGDNPTTYKYPKCSNLDGLNEEQASFVNCALKYSHSYLWGPPGTGKTQALGALISEFFKYQERSLICSTTNQAVDQVLLKLCRTLKQAKRIGDLEAGKIVRVGRIQQSELMEEFSGYITVDGIASRRSSELTQELKKCEAELAKEEEEYLKFEHTIQSYEHLQQLEQDFISNKKEFDRNFNKAKELQQNIETNQHRVDELQLEIENYSSKGLFGRMVSRNPENIGAEKRQLERANLGKLTVLNELKPLVLKQKESLESQKREIDRIKKQLGGHDLTRVLETAENISEKIDSVRAKITEIKKKIDEISKTILLEATIVGATLTKTYLSPSDLGKYQNIIIDEASMGFIPAIYFTASQSEKRCIISGDFRQLPPIVPTNSKDVEELIGRNIFDHAGLEEQFEAGTNPDNAHVLTKQYRMDPKICDLVSNIGYEGLLKTAPERVPQSLPALEGLDDSIIIIDTSPFYPFCQRDPYNSTSNVTHALIARNLIRQLGKSINMGSVGYCAPFKAQIKLLKRMVDDDLDNPSAIGTVHTYQGDEKDTIIFDTVQSLGEKYALSPGLSQELARHSQLLTVAVTRAKERLIFLANLKYLDGKIPANGYLRSILASVQANGTVLDARKIIDLAPLQNEILSYTPNLKELGIADNALENGLVNEDSFYPLLNVDIENAKKYIAIYSGFYAPDRVSKLLPVLKSKIEEGIKIRIIIPPPSKNGSIGETDSRAIVDIMRQAGVLVELRGRIHQKAVLLDESVVWFGSLNPLSFSGATEESMWRIEKEGITGIVGANMAVNRLSAKDDPKLIVQRELHDCSHCGSLVAFYRGKFGDYVRCIDCNQAEKFRVK